MKKKYMKWMLSLLIAISSTYGQADDGFDSNVVTSLNYDDNIYKVTDALKDGDEFLYLEPRLSLTGLLTKHKFTINYYGNYARYASLDSANYEDHELKGRINLSHSVRLSTRMEAGIKRDHEEPGSINLVQLDLQDYNKYSQKYFISGINYGRDSATGNVGFEYRYISKDYRNNGLDYLDFSSNSFSPDFTYNYSSKLKFYLKALFTDYMYDSETASQIALDNLYSNYSVGSKWIFSAKLSGEINLGYQKRDYTSTELADIDGLSFYGNIEWLINTYSKVYFLASRESIDTTIENSSGALRNAFSVNIEHELTPRTVANFLYRYAKDDIVMSSDREDKRQELVFSIHYTLTDRLSTFAKYQYHDRESTIDFAAFTSNQYSLGLKYKFGN